MMLHAVIGVGIFGHLVKLYKPNESNYLFDGASLVLYMVAVVLYATSVLNGMSPASRGVSLTGQRIEECSSGRVW